MALGGRDHLDRDGDQPEGNGPFPYGSHVSSLLWDSQGMPYTEVEGRRLALSNLDKVLYPATGFTKGEALHYYATVAEALLPHLQGRPVSFLRYPDGVDATAFFAKNVPPGTPDWVTVREITEVSSTPAAPGAGPGPRDSRVGGQPRRTGAAHPAVARRTRGPGGPARLRPRPRPGSRRPGVPHRSRCGCGTGSRPTTSLCCRRPPAARACTCWRPSRSPRPRRPPPTPRSWRWRPRRHCPGWRSARWPRRCGPARSSSTTRRTPPPRPPPPPTRCAPSGSPSVSTPLTWDELAAAEHRRGAGLPRRRGCPRGWSASGDLLAPLLDPELVRPLPGPDGGGGSRTRAADAHVRHDDGGRPGAIRAARRRTPEVRTTSCWCPSRRPSASCGRGAPGPSR